MSDREQAIEKLTEWQRQKPWARREPRQLEIVSVERSGPLRISLRTEIETRGVRYWLVPAPVRDMQPPAPPDPWAISLALPENAPVGHEVSESLTDLRVTMDCMGCSAAGQLKCDPCDGTGSVRRGRVVYRCEVCGGRGEVFCRDCNGSGGVVGTPTVWARVESKDEMRASDTDDLPLEVALDLGESTEPGELVHRFETAQVSEVARGGYREQALPARVVDQARALVEASSLPPRARVRARRIEIRRTPVLVVKLASGETLHVWGSPAKVTPAAPAQTLLGRLFSR